MARMIGFVFQSFNLIDELNVRENIELPLLYMGVSGKERRKRHGSKEGKLGVEGLRPQVILDTVFTSYRPSTRIASLMRVISFPPSALPPW